MIADVKQKYGYDIQPSDADARQEAQYQVTQAYIACLTNSAIKQEDDTVRRAEQENAANAAAASALSDTANSLNNAATQTYMPPSSYTIPDTPMAPLPGVPLPEYQPYQPAPEQTTPYPSSSQQTPWTQFYNQTHGLNPDGTAR